MKKTAITMVFLLAATVASAQKPEKSLVELAREAAAPNRPRATRIYTEDDLARLRTLPINLVGVLRTEEEEEATPASSTDTAEAYWRARFANARQEVAMAQAEIARLQNQFRQETSKAVLLMDWSVLPCTSNGVFAPGYSGADDLNDLCGQVNGAKARLESAKAELAGLDDELRRAGGYPGWGRD